MYMVKNEYFSNKCLVKNTYAAYIHIVKNEYTYRCCGEWKMLEMGKTGTENQSMLWSNHLKRNEIFFDHVSQYLPTSMVEKSTFKISS
jgi:hypothetical protein